MSKKKMALLIAIIILCLTAGCSAQEKLINKSAETPQLIKVEIHFTGAQAPIISYVRDLDIANNGKLYSGGSSSYYLYDEKGDLIGIANYQRIEYIKVIK